MNTTFTAAAVEIDDGGEIDGEDNAVVISARIPDMKDGDATGYPEAGQTLVMVVSNAAGIKNPSEERYARALDSPSSEAPTTGPMKPRCMISALGTICQRWAKTADQGQDFAERG